MKDMNRPLPDQATCDTHSPQQRVPIQNTISSGPSLSLLPSPSQFKQATEIDSTLYASPHPQVYVCKVNLPTCPPPKESSIE